MFPKSILLILCLLGPVVSAQRNLLHWRRDLEYRLRSYLGHRDTINNILDSSISRPDKIFTARNVRFSDLIVPTGALLMDPQVSRPTVRLLMNKTQGYVSAKMNELYQVKNQLEVIRRQVEDPRQPYIYKGLPTRGPRPVVALKGTWVFRQFMYGQILSSHRVDVKQVNFTDVDRVINETYMANSELNPYDSQSRLFFEGRKTFWNTLFAGTLRSGCCDRLKPLHTSRMMLRSANQVVAAPIQLQTDEATRIDTLETAKMFNTGQENPIYPHSLIPIAKPFNLELSKTIIFKNGIIVDEAHLSASPLAPENKLVIGFTWNRNMAPFELSHENYLLKTGPAQRVPGTVILNAESHFLRPIDATAVNGITNFQRFVLESIVRVDRPAIIRGPVQFNALPAIWLNRPPDDVVMIHVDKGLDVGPVNGMLLPHHVVLLPPNSRARQPHELIVVHGPRQFSGELVANNLMQVNQLINGLKMPDDVIPLHLNDFMSSVGHSHLWFLDGIVANHLTIQGGQFDDINLRGAHADANNLIMNSMFSPQPDGTQLIRAPLRVNHVKLTGSLNGFRPQNLDLTRDDTINGKKTFLAPVEAQDCIIGNINNLPNWPSHLIRIDRPGTVQTVQTRLSFGQPGSVSVQDLRVQFYPQQHHLSNWNLSPEFLVLQQALAKETTNHTIGRYRVDHVRLGGRINNVSLDDIITLDRPIRFADRYVLVGKVEVYGNLFANRITSSYPLDAMDLVQFNMYRVPILGSPMPIHLSNLVLAGNNHASYLNCRMLNGVSFDEFADSIMSLTRPQTIDTGLVFNTQVNLEGFIRTESSVNSIKNFNQFASRLREASYSFEDGLQCNSVVIRSNKFV